MASHRFGLRLDKYAGKAVGVLHNMFFNIFLKRVSSKLYVQPAFLAFLFFLLCPHGKKKVGSHWSERLPRFHGFGKAWIARTYVCCSTHGLETFMLVFVSCARCPGVRGAARRAGALDADRQEGQARLGGEQCSCPADSDLPLFSRFINHKNRPASYQKLRCRIFPNF